MGVTRRMVSMRDAHNKTVIGVWERQKLFEAAGHKWFIAQCLQTKRQKQFKTVDVKELCMHP